MNTMNQPTHYPTVYMPGTGEKVPAIMTEKEVIRFMRLDTVGVKDPHRSLRDYRRRYPGILKPIQQSKKLMYMLPNVLEFMEKRGDINPH